MAAPRSSPHERRSPANRRPTGSPRPRRAGRSRSGPSRCGALTLRSHVRRRLARRPAQPSPAWRHVRRGRAGAGLRRAAPQYEPGGSCDPGCFPRRPPPPGTPLPRDVRRRARAAALGVSPHGIAAGYARQRAAPGRKDGTASGEDSAHPAESLRPGRPRAAALGLPAHAAQQHRKGPAEVELRFPTGCANGRIPAVGRAEGPRGADLLSQLCGEREPEATAAPEPAPVQGGKGSPVDPDSTGRETKGFQANSSWEGPRRKEKKADVFNRLLLREEANQDEYTSCCKEANCSKASIGLSCTREATSICWVSSALKNFCAGLDP